MASKTQVCNLALIHLGNSKLIANVETENSITAKAFRLVFDDERDFILRDFWWSFAKKYRALALVEGSTEDPTNRDWTFSYRVPADCVEARRLIVDTLGRNNPDPPAWELGQDDTGALLYTDEESAVLEYTAKVTDVGRFDPIFRSALSWRLAMSVSGSLGRINGIVDTCNRQYEYEIGKAKMHAANERQRDAAGPSEFERARS